MVEVTDERHEEKRDELIAICEGYSWRVTMIVEKELIVGGPDTEWLHDYGPEVDDFDSLEDMTVEKYLELCAQKAEEYADNGWTDRSSNGQCWDNADYGNCWVEDVALQSSTGADLVALSKEGE